MTFSCNTFIRRFNYTEKAQYECEFNDVTRTFPFKKEFIKNMAVGIRPIQDQRVVCRNVWSELLKTKNTIGKQQACR